MSGAVALLRVRSSRAPYRRGGIEFGNLPLFLGPEHFADGIDGLRSLTAIVTDPVLTVHMADIDTPELFLPVPDEARAALIDTLRAVEVAEDKSTLNEAVAYIVAGLIGERAPDVAAEQAAKEARRLADEAETKRLTDEAEAKRVAKEAETKRLADEAEAKRLVDEAEAKRLADAAAADPSPPAQVPAVEVAPGVTVPVSMGAGAKTEPKKGDAAPVKAKAETVAKPQGSSGRQSKPAATTTDKG